MQLDLNLLTAFDALLEEGSVMGAAARMRLSTPAMSRTLGRIRSATGDPILVRTGRTMTPTPYASGVQGQVHLLVQQARAVLTPHHQLDLTTLERTFTLESHDTVTSAIAAALVAAVHAQAPGVKLRFLAEPATDTHELRHGRIDLQIGGTQPTQPDIRYQSLGAGDVAVVVRAGHPLIDAGCTIARYAAQEHIIVSRRGRLQDLLDNALAEHGLTRRVVAAVPTSTAALQIVQATDAVTAVPPQGCRPLIQALDLRILPLPLTLPPLKIICAWHQRYDSDPAHAWLRREVRRALHHGIPELP